MTAAPSETVRAYLLALHNHLCQSISAEDKTPFHEDKWSSVIGDGRTHILRDGNVFEQVGVNFSHIRASALPEAASARHPELTGRDNVYLNGTILGMRKAEVDRKFDEIVEFSGVERFLDTPVKRYSSGMQVRLAFSVAAHLDPEILLVDEVLAVGDAAFQKKCLGKMHDVAKEGRTVLFVSHVMQAVRNLCERSLYVEAGKLESDGPTETVLRDYLTGGDTPRSEITWHDPGLRPGDESFKLRAVKVLSGYGNPCLLYTSPSPRD